MLEWQRAFANLPAGISLLYFERRGPYAWWFTLGIDDHTPFSFGPTDGVGWLTAHWLSAPETRGHRSGLIVFGRRNRPRRALALVNQALSLLPKLMPFSWPCASSM